MEIKNTGMQGLDEVWHILYADGKREKTDKRRRDSVWINCMT